MFRPATSESTKIIDLLDAGMSVARFNFSHGTEKVSLQTLTHFQSNATLLRRFAEAKKLRPYKTCALMMDLRGRALRTSAFQRPVTLCGGDLVEIRTEGLEVMSSREEIQINQRDLPSVMREGDQLIIGSDVKCSVTEVARTSFTVEVQAGGIVDSYSPVTVAGARLQQLPVLQLDDKLDIKKIAEKHAFDFIVVPHVLAGRDIQEVKLSLGENNRAKVLAKIDSIDAVSNFESIIKQADGVVILRKDMSIELSPEKLVLAQKWMVQTANIAAIPVFIQS